MMPLFKDGPNNTKIVAGFLNSEEFSLTFDAREKDNEGNVSKVIKKGICTTTISYNFDKGYGSISSSIVPEKRWWQLWK